MSSGAVLCGALCTLVANSFLSLLAPGSPAHTRSSYVSASLQSTLPQPPPASCVPRVCQGLFCPRIFAQTVSSAWNAIPPGSILLTSSLKANVLSSEGPPQGTSMTVISLCLFSSQHLTPSEVYLVCLLRSKLPEARCCPFLLSCLHSPPQRLAQGTHSNIACISKPQTRGNSEEGKGNFLLL